MNIKKWTVLSLALFASWISACNTDFIEDDEQFAAFVCTVVPWFVADCTDEAVQDKVREVLVEGAVSDELKCRGIAVGASHAVSLYYHASRIQDGPSGDSSCNARADVSNSTATGPVQATGTELTRRGDPRADSCPVTLFFPAMIRTTVAVVDGAVRFEGPGCTTTPGTACVLPITPGACSGDLESF